MQVGILQDRIAKRHHDLAQHAIIKGRDVCMRRIGQESAGALLQNGIKRAVVMVPAIRSGRAEQKSVTGLASRSVGRFASAATAIASAVPTKRKSARVASAF